MKNANSPHGRVARASFVDPNCLQCTYPLNRNLAYSLIHALAQ